MENVNVFWFRRDLRSQDNRGLYKALIGGLPVLPIFIFDRNILDELDDKRDARVMFIHQQVNLLHKEFKRYNSSLEVFHDTPLSTFKRLQTKYNINRVFTNEDYEPYAKRRDQEVRRLLEERGIELVLVKDHVIFDPTEIMTDQGNPYKVYTPYKNRWREKLQTSDYKVVDSEGALSGLIKKEPDEVPELIDLGFKKSNQKIPDMRMEDQLISAYQEKRDYPGIRGTSRLGIHLRHGTISVRSAVRKGVESSDTWLNELIWREFYMMILYHWPQVVDQAFKPAYDQIEWINDEALFQAWCQGKTGYPIVDAGMRELNETGFMHNRVRMITSSFLTKMLLIDWRWGERYFAEKLLDYELASNNGGWQWAAGTGTDAQPYFRIFNPYSQTEKFDKELTYIRKWVKEFDTEKYPDPVVDYKFARERALETYKQALA